MRSLLSMTALFLKHHERPAVLQCTSGKSAAGKTITVKEAQCASTSSAHARPDIGRSPATPNVPKSEVQTVLFL